MLRAPLARALQSSRLIAGTAPTAGCIGRRAVTTWIVEDVRNAKYGTGAISLVMLGALGAGAAGMMYSLSGRASRSHGRGTMGGEMFGVFGVVYGGRLFRY